MFDVYKKMASRKDFAETIGEGLDSATEDDLANGTSEKWQKTQIMFSVAQLQVLLDIRDIVEGIDRRMGAQSIIKKVAKNKK